MLSTTQIKHGDFFNARKWFCFPPPPTPAPTVTFTTQNFHLIEVRLPPPPYTPVKFL